MKRRKLTEKEHMGLTAWWWRVLEVLREGHAFPVAYRLKVNDVSGASAEVRSSPELRAKAGKT